MSYADKETNIIIDNYIKLFKESNLKEAFFDDYDFIREKMNFSNDFKKIDNISEQLSLVENYMRFRNIIFNSNLRLVNSIADFYKNISLENLELCSEGSIGLLKAIYRYDPEFKNRFATYAVDWIKNYITRSLSDLGSAIRIPIGYKTNMLKVKKFITDYNTKYGCSPSIEEISNSLNFPEDKIEDMMRFFNTTDLLSLDCCPQYDNEFSLKDAVFDKEKNDYADIYRKEKIELVWKCLDLLTEKDRDILILRFGLLDGNVLKLQEVGDKYHLTRERIR